MENDVEQNPKLPADQVLRAYSPRPRVRRLNRAAIALLFLAIGLLFGGRMIVGLFNRYAAKIVNQERQQDRLRPPDDLAERSVIGKLPADYTFTIPPPSPPKPEPTKTEEEPEAAPIDPNLMKQLEALRREQETAMNSPIQFLNVHRSSEQQTKHGTDDEYSSQDIGYQASSSGSDLRFDAERREFFRDATKVETRVRSRFLPPRSPYEIKAGTILPAALITPINSDLPGDVVGQVTTNIYDWMSGRFLLVPQGSRLIGRYNSEVLKGQNRALIAWQRLILPNGYSIVLEAMPGTDAQGVAGMADQVDWHSRRIAGATLLSTLIALGGNYAANINPEQKEFSIVGETVAQDAARVGQRVIDRELDLRPTIVVRQGMPFNVLVTKDLELLPYQPVINQR